MGRGMEKYLFKVVVTVNEGAENRGSGGRPRADSFTGKLVKSLLIDGNPRLKPFFEKASGGSPKLVHITPLYIERVESGKLHVRCVHSIKYVDGSSRYSFYVGFIETATAVSPTFDDVYDAIINLSGRRRFGANVFDVGLISAESVDVVREAKKAVSDLARFGKIRVVFASPTLLRDPFRIGKYKSLTPTPMNVFSTPIYVNLHTMGRLKWRSFIETLIIIHRLLNEPYSIHKTIKVIRLKYEEGKNPIPALIGYVNLYLNKHYLDLYTAKGVDTGALLEETFATALALGVGTSRATGFGHTKITTPTSGIQL
ncbi:MAG: CRISPR system precrRNA processing endoribonuclease RAMP protein Cas6 [Sulfolobales archaeon]